MIPMALAVKTYRLKHDTRNKNTTSSTRQRIQAPTPPQTTATPPPPHTIATPPPPKTLKAPSSPGQRNQHRRLRQLTQHHYHLRNAHLFLLESDTTFFAREDDYHYRKWVRNLVVYAHFLIE